MLYKGDTHHNRLSGTLINNVCMGKPINYNGKVYHCNIIKTVFEHHIIAFTEIKKEQSYTR